MLMLTSLLFFTLPVNAQGETVYIRADGTIDPPTASILRDGDVYTFTDNILGSIVVEKSNIIIDGNGYALQGSGSGKGFQLDGIDNVTIHNVIIKGFANAIVINVSSFNVISGNTIQDNGGFMGSVILESPYSNYNNTFSGNTFSNNTGSCIVLHGLYATVSDNIIANNTGLGINLDSGYITVSGNIITNNTGGGIAVYGWNNNVFGNNVTNHTSELTGQGILLDFGASTNNVVGNIIEDNKVGILLGDSSDNTIAHNNFISNTKQAISDSINIWDNGSEGNYWSDYTGTDSNSDDVGDTPYVIDENNQDNYPLMAQVDISVIPEISSLVPIACLFALAVAIAVYKRRVSKN